MPEVSSHKPGTFCWADLATTDAAGSKDFYCQLLGWTSMDNPIEGTEMVYSMMQKDGKNVCGLYQMDSGMLEQGIPPNWTSYIAVTDADAGAKQAAAAGGTVLMGPADVFEAGRMAMVQDSTGAVFGMWQAKEHIGAELIYAPGALGWNELYTNDTAAAAKFYADVFGWGRNTHQPGPEGAECAEQYAEQYNMFTSGDNQVGGMMQIRPEWGEVPPNWSVYFCVDNCAASQEKAQSMGAEVVVPMLEMQNVRFAFLKDPQGVYLGIVQMVG